VERLELPPPEERRRASVMLDVMEVREENEDEEKRMRMGMFRSEITLKSHTMYICSGFTSCHIISYDITL
jgi:hypothetical protein